MPRINPEERAYRESVLRDIERHMAECGRHVAQDHADRARQFMPFAALRGYHELARDQEAVRIPRPELSEERLAELSESMRELSRNEDVRVSFYEKGQRIALRGPLMHVDEVRRSVFVGGKRIPFASILDIERPCDG